MKNRHSGEYASIPAVVESITIFFWSLKMSLFRSKNAKSSSKRAPKPRSLRLESLESRELLSVSVAEFNAIRSQYADLNLSSNMANYNVIEITAAQLSDANLRNAITTARTTTKSDLIVCRTTASQNKITLSGTALTISSIPASMGSVMIVGYGTTNLTIDADSVSGKNSNVFTITNSNVALAGLTITGGKTAKGGGISFFASSCSLTITKCEITRNTASAYGGGIDAEGDVTITSSLISDNTTGGYGGGIIVNNGGGGIIDNSIISKNTANIGGGIHASSSPTKELRIVNSTISDNTATASGSGRGPGGGGICTDSTTVTIVNCTVSENNASNGAGLYLFGSTTNTIIGTTIAGNRGEGATARGGGVFIYGACDRADFINTVIAGNSAVDGGGIYNESSYTTIVNSTIAGNEATQQGGGLANMGVMAVRNSIVTKNSSPDSADLWTNWGSTNAVTSVKYTLIGNSSTQSRATFTDEGCNLIDRDPRFVVSPSSPLSSWRTWNLQLSSSSPALNAGNSSESLLSGVTTDRGGNARFAGTVDMGAYEYSPLGVPQFTAIGISGGVKLTWTAIAGADRYVAWRRNATNTAWIELGSVTGTTFTDTTGRVNVAETYAVRAFSGTEKSSYLTVKGTALLGVPQVKASGVLGGVKLSWDAINGADKYVAWRRNETNTAWIVLGTFTGTTFIDTAVRIGVAETYAVRAYQGTKESSYRAVKGTALPATLGVPQVTATGVAGGVKLTWDAVDGADRYFAWRRNATNTAWIELGTFTGTTLTDTAARVGVAETYAVRAYQGTKESSYRTVKGTALLGVPQVKATGVSGGVKLTWDAITGADRYVAWRRNETNTAWIELGTFTGTTFTDTAARVGIAETYAVRAYQGTKESSYRTVKGTRPAIANAFFDLADAEIDALFLQPSV